MNYKKRIVLGFFFILVGKFLVADSWSIQLLVQKPECNDLYTFWGEDPLASDELDNLDMVNWNPGITPWVDCYFPHPEWTSGAGNYAADIRNDSLTEKNWLTEIASSTNGYQDYSLEIQNIETLPEYYNCYLQYQDELFCLRDTNTITLMGNNSINFTIFTSFIPFILNNPDSLVVFHNIPYEINLNQVFGYYGEEDLNFSYIENQYIIQSIIDSIYTVSADSTWVGLTSAIITAFTANDSINLELDVSVFNYYYGDIDLNDEIDAYDASLIMQHIVQINNLQPEIQLRADVDGNQIIDAYDASLVLRFAVGFIDSFPILIRSRK